MTRRVTARKTFHRHCARHVPSRCHLATPKQCKDNQVPDNMMALFEKVKQLSEDRRVPINGENADDFRGGSNHEVKQEPSSDLGPMAPECLSFSEGELCKSPGPDLELLSPTSDNVFCDGNISFDLDPHHSNHSSLSQGYCSASGSESMHFQEYEAVSHSHYRRSREERRALWLSPPCRGQTFDFATPTAKGAVGYIKPPSPRSARIGTWPLDPYCHVNQTDIEDAIEDRTDEWLPDDEESNASANIREARERLREWAIDHKDFKFGDCMRKGKDSDIYRGNWHGEVLIHTRRNVTNMEDFLDEVATLSMIRHDNVTLFMGTCIDEPNLAIITSIHKGPSLYDKLHVEAAKMSMSSKIRIARQITQAMSYLHAKEILVPHLNSRAIYLESKVKLCMMGESMESQASSSETVQIQEGEVTYLPPEILQTARVTPPSLCYDAERTKDADVYAFGTILYELLTGRFPFRKESLESIVYKVCKGQRATLPEDVRCPPSLKRIHKECWSQLPEKRPTFSSILSHLSHNIAHVNRRHSFSEPDITSKKLVRPW